MERDGEPAGAGVVRFVTGVIKGLLAVVATIGVLQALGFNVTSLLAGLGIGGIAVALAAQKTLENLLGGIALMADKPGEGGRNVPLRRQVGCGGGVRLPVHESPHL